MSRTCKVGGKNTASPPGEDDFSTTPGGLDLALYEQDTDYLCL
ncbi:MAG: hypothetical protein ACI4TD_07020 [Phocaeicola sp.]